jgi:hypothetical protein
MKISTVSAVNNTSPASEPTFSLELESLARKIVRIGFRCTRCGACCRDDPGEPALVIVGAGEIRKIRSRYGYSRDEVAQPYPETIRGSHGEIYTLDWAVRHACGQCRFLEGAVCTIYEARPWICRTYPFMLDQGHLVESSCPGIGGAISFDEAKDLARVLIERSEAEEREIFHIRELLDKGSLPSGQFVVVDSEGIKHVGQEGQSRDPVEDNL